MELFHLAISRFRSVWLAMDLAVNVAEPSNMRSQSFNIVRESYCCMYTTSRQVIPHQVLLYRVEPYFINKSRRRVLWSDDRRQ